MRSTGAVDGYAEIFKFPCCQLIVKDFLGNEYDPPSQFRVDGCEEIPTEIQYDYQPRTNEYHSTVLWRFKAMLECAVAGKIYTQKTED